MKEYKVINGTYFDKRTPDSVCNILDCHIHNKSERIRIFYGDTETGEDWNEVYDNSNLVINELNPSDL